MASSPVLLGHRGARATATVPENTLPSFDLALQHGCDGFEFDVRLTADGRALICHDRAVGNLTVCNVTSNQLPQCPLLEDVLKDYGARAFLDIELKVGDLEPCVLEALRACQPQRGFVVSSFLPEVIMELKVRCGAVPVGILCDTQTQLARWRKLPVDYVIAEHHLLSAELVEEVHAVGRKVFVWTVNNAVEMLRLAGWGVDGIISDDTQLLTRTFRSGALAKAQQK